MITFPNVPATYIVGNLVGGLIFGVGMALSGYCPAPAPPARGEGKLDYLIPGLLGFLAGAVIFGLTYQQVFPVISAIANYRQRRHPRPVEPQPVPDRRAFSR